MTKPKSCFQSLSIPVMFWTGVFLVLLARGIYCDTEDPTHYARYPRYELDADIHGYSPNLQETFNAMNFLRELIQKQQQRSSQQMQMYNNGDDLSEAILDWRKVTFPLFYRIRSFINDRSKEESKRGSSKYMSHCHFKICNMGKRKRNLEE